MAKVKIYTIKITEPYAWYENRVGEVFSAIIEKKQNGMLAFKISQPPFFFISQLHCKVIDEKIIETKNS